MADTVARREITVEVTIYNLLLKENYTSQDVYNPKSSTRGQIMLSTF